MQKFILNRLHRWNFCIPESFSYGLRSKCADLLSGYDQITMMLSTLSSITADSTIPDVEDFETIEEEEEDDTAAEGNK